MPLIGVPGDDTVVEECIEELEELLMGLDRFPAAAVAVAMGTCLEGLLGALLDERRCTTEEARELLREIESGVLQERKGPNSGYTEADDV